jgi:hypothetical protein
MLYDIELNLYKSHFLNCHPVVSGTNTNLCSSVSQIFWYLMYTFPRALKKHIWP